MEKIGIINKTKLAKEKNINAQREENETLGEYEELISKVTGSRDENITININELTSLINQIVDNKINNVNGTPTGSILAQMGNNAPEGYLFCDGTEYNINDYKNLAEYIKNQFGNYSYFGGNGTTTFAVPNLTQGSYLKGYTAAGVDEEAGLPNITGYTSGYWHNYSHGTPTGAFSGSSVVNDSVQGHGSYNGKWIVNPTFDASKSNPIYGKSSTVTPKNTSVLYCIKY